MGTTATTTRTDVVSAIISSMCFNLVDEPWLHGFGDAGAADVSLRDVLADSARIYTVVGDDPLETAAVHQLLFAIRLAAHAADMTDLDWLDAHQHRFDLFDPDLPFGQNAAMRPHIDTKGTVRPVAAFPLFTTGNGSMVFGHLHNLSGLRLAPAKAARTLLVRQTFSTGGMQQFVATPFGRTAISAKSAVNLLRPVVWLRGATLADTLDANTRPYLNQPAGTFHFSWPNGVTPSTVGTPTGVLDALTWPVRSILLLPDADGQVSHTMLCDGLRWPDDLDPADEARLIPHTVRYRKTPKDPYTPQRVSHHLPLWRQVLTAGDVGSIHTLPTFLAVRPPATDKDLFDYDPAADCPSLEWLLAHCLEVAAQEHPDALFVRFNHTDHAQESLEWRARHHPSEERRTICAATIAATYSAVASVVEELVASIDDLTDVIVVSDHGITPATAQLSHQWILSQVAPRSGWELISCDSALIRARLARGSELSYPHIARLNTDYGLDLRWEPTQSADCHTAPILAIYGAPPVEFILGTAEPQTVTIGAHGYQPTCSDMDAVFGHFAKPNLIQSFVAAPDCVRDIRRYIESVLQERNVI